MCSLCPSVPFSIEFTNALTRIFVYPRLAMRLTELVTPLAVALNAIPIVVLVTVFINMFGSTTVWQASPE